VSTYHHVFFSCDIKIFFHSFATWQDSLWMCTIFVWIYSTYLVIIWYWRKNMWSVESGTNYISFDRQLKVTYTPTHMTTHLEQGRTWANALLQADAWCYHLPPVSWGLQRPHEHWGRHWGRPLYAVFEHEHDDEIGFNLNNILSQMPEVKPKIDPCCKVRGKSCRAVSGERSTFCLFASRGARITSNFTRVLNIETVLSLSDCQNIMCQLYQL
jgi:hypothetical protein